MRTFLSLPLLLLLSAHLHAQSDEPRAVPGTRVSLVPPAGFVSTDRFPGFTDDSWGASIMVIDLPGPFPQVSASLIDREKLAAKGIILIGHEDIEITGVKGVLVKLKQSAHGVDYLKWTLAFGDESETVMINATYPEELDSVMSEKMKRSILTATWARDRKIPANEGIAFTVAETADMKRARQVANSLVFSRNGVFPSSSPYDPLFIAGRSFSKASIDDRKAFAMARVLATVDIAGIRIETTEPVEINGMQGYEITAGGKDRDSGEPMFLYYTILFEKGGYYILHGSVGADERAAYLKVFQEMARSFRRQ
jgi:hypothetical protein